LDLESPGPTFAQRALEALQTPRGPLQGLAVTLNYIPYDWKQAQRLRDYLQTLNFDKAVVVVSSEGGLFDYGTDEEILTNLEILYDITPSDAVLAGTITPVGGPGRIFNRVNGVRIVPRTLTDFERLIGQAGWMVQESIEQPMNHVVGMRKISRLDVMK